ncbi:S-adenosylmethionine decarboxylase family protein [Veillonella montpellierensis]|uniref:S-adenosylmethionine decarboxylase family protein n=1 Tax=Veillonella montpellierensis TaxID=187328 RepID=UPI0023F673C3|nr:S-adenosylmethionine decarboxylase [Veillonella montpellierensis]
MSEALGQHLLIDFYACLGESVSSPILLQESLATAMEVANQHIDEISCQVMDDEIVLIAIAPHFHVCLHTYPELGYVAVDIYEFHNTVPATLLMKELKRAFHAEKVKATSIRRADFGSERDMKPRRRTTLTALGRVNRTRIQIKQTGTKLKSTGTKVFKAITKQNKKRQ